METVVAVAAAVAVAAGAAGWVTAVVVDMEAIFSSSVVTLPPFLVGVVIELLLYAATAARAASVAGVVAAVEEGESSVFPLGLAMGGAS